MEFNADDILFKAKMPVTNLYFLESGLVKVVHSNGGTNAVSQLINKGNFLGLTDILTQKVYSQTVYCADRVSVRLFDAAAVRNFLLKDADTAQSVIQSIKLQDVHRLELYIQMLKYPVEKRVIHFLIWLMEDVYESPVFTLKIDRSEIASYLSTSTKTLNRILKHLKQNQLLSFYGKKIRIVNKPGLLSMKF